MESSTYSSMILNKSDITQVRIQVSDQLWAHVCRFSQRH